MPTHVSEWSGVRLRPIDFWNLEFETSRERIAAIVIFQAESFTSV
jgi:hypothetical protein